MQLHYTEKMMIKTFQLSALIFFLSITQNGNAQSWPAGPVKIIVPYAAGGGVDPVARLVSQKLAEIWKQPVVVENKAGGSGTIGAAARQAAWDRICAA